MLNGFGLVAMDSVLFSLLIYMTKLYHPPHYVYVETNPIYKDLELPHSQTREWKLRNAIFPTESNMMTK